MVANLTTYTFLKNNTDIENQEVLWTWIEYITKGCFIFSLILFVPWIMLDLLSGEPVAERVLRFLLRRKSKKVCFQLKNESTIQLPVRSKREAMKIFAFIDINSMNS